MESSSSTVRTSIQVWCHICGLERTGNLNSETQEYNCSTCSSECVEEVSQGVEQFVSTPLPPPPSAPSTSSLLSQVARSGSITTHFTTSASGRPVSVIIRQISATADANSAASSYGSQSGVLNLLNNIGSYSGNDRLSEDEAMARIMHHILMNERSHAGAPAASDDTISHLRKETLSATDDLAALGECNISQEAFEVGDVVVSLPCGHLYKEENIVYWLKMHNTCPVCRVEVTEVPAAEEEAASR